MSPRVNTEDLIDARGVAKVLGLSHAESVSTYQRRYGDMPRPVINLGHKRPRLWIRQDIEAWARRAGHGQDPPPARRGAQKR
jgi:predicted DNA-binding transcriptional regulator AlpA